MITRRGSGVMEGGVAARIIQSIMEADRAECLAHLASTGQIPSCAACKKPLPRTVIRQAPQYCAACQIANLEAENSVAVTVAHLHAGTMRQPKPVEHEKERNLVLPDL